MQAISRLQIASVVPPEDQISFKDIAIATGLSESLTQRLLRHAMTMRVFCEPEPNMVAHSRASKWLSQPECNNWLSTGSEIMWPAVMKVRGLCLPILYEV